MAAKRTGPAQGSSRSPRLVGVAELKARLSHHLRAVRAGQRITVTDHNRPIAVLAPIERRPKLPVRKPLPGAPRLRDIPLPPPLELPPGFDPLEFLFEDRRRR